MAGTPTFDSETITVQAVVPTMAPGDSSTNAASTAFSTAAVGTETAARIAGDAFEATARTNAIGVETTRATAAEALLAPLSGFASSFGANGYQKLPTGFIMQRGNSVTGGGGGVTVTFPIAFPTACLKVNCTVVNSGTQPIALLATTGLSRSGFGVNTANTSGAFLGGVSFYWDAEGY